MAEDWSMMKNRSDTAAHLLLTLLSSAETDTPIKASHLLVELGIDRSSLVRSLQRLADRGLVDPKRLRLTLPGLAVAAGLRRQQQALAA